MYSQITVLVAMGLLQAVPPAPGVDGSTAPPLLPLQSIAYSSSLTTGCCESGDACGVCDECDLGKLRVPKNTTGDMPPHYAYPPANHGYYYFRPYNYISILDHQQRALSMGGDPRAPYANKVFERVYAESDSGAYEAGSAGARLPLPAANFDGLPDLIETLKGGR